MMPVLLRRVLRCLSERVSKKKTPMKGKIPSKRVKHSKDSCSKTAAHAPAFGRPSVDSHLLFGASTVTTRDFEKYKDKGYLDDPECCQPGGSDTTPAPKSDEIVLFESFLLQGLRLPINDFVAEVLECFEVFFHQVTPDTFLWMSVYVWALASQGLKPNPETFCRSHVLCLKGKKTKQRRSIQTSDVIPLKQRVGLLARLSFAKPIGIQTGPRNGFTSVLILISEKSINPC